MGQRAWCGAVLVACVVSGACQTTPQRTPQALVVVATDADVPRAVNRLRVDVFDSTGAWIDSRDYPRPRPDDWPASFGIESTDESRETTILLRLRAYVDGATREYVGERFAPIPTYAPTPVASSLASLCADAPELPPSTDLTLRRGGTPLFASSCRTTPVDTGSVAAKITIPSHDTYHFEVVRSVPGASFSNVDAIVVLRRTCAASIDLGCGDYFSPNNFLTRLVTTLDPGTYWLLTAGQLFGEPADLTLRWAPEASWTTPPQAPPILPPPAAVANVPRLVKDGADATPRSEPDPLATIERLVRVRLVPGSVTRANVSLPIRCSGVMAKLAVDAASGLVDPNASTTCRSGPGLEDVDDVGPESPGPSDLDAPPTGPSTENCADTDSDDHVVCVPGGSFVLGSESTNALSVAVPAPTLPVRLTGISRFWMDRYEFTIARYRQSLAAGYKVKDTIPPIANDGPLVAGEDATLATFTTTPGNREHFPLESITADLARELCEFWSGELPTEAQWEYAALAAGRSVKAIYPWGDAPPTCGQAVLSLPGGYGTVVCGSHTAGPQAVDSERNAADVNALGIVGLGGSVAERTRDALAAYDAPCFRASGAIDPECVDPTAPLRAARGGSWNLPLVYAVGARRDPASNRGAAAAGFTGVGFRCVYGQVPSREWKGP